MSRLSLVLAILLVSLVAVPLVTTAQSNDLIILNNATPGIDIVVSPAPNTTGTVALQVSGAAISVLDSAGNTVFQAADARLKGVELHFVPNASPYTITITRLPNVTEAYVVALSQTDLTLDPTLQTVETLPLALNQGLTINLNDQLPSQNIPVTIAANTEGSVITNFAEQAFTEQVVDSQGVAVATLYASQIDGINLTLAAGDYTLTLLNGLSGQTATGLVGLQLPAIADLPAPVFAAASRNTPEAAPITPTAVPPVAAACTFQVGNTPTNLRSGPGEGYSVIGLIQANQQLAVGGRNPEQNWLVVASGEVSAWISQTTGTLSGDCSTLTVYNIPLLEAVAPSMSIQPRYDDDDEYEGEEEEHEEEDEEGEDDD